MNNKAILSLLTIIGVMFLIYTVARLLNNWSLDRENKNKEGLINIVLTLLISILYVVSFPVSAIVFGLHLSPLNHAIDKAEREAHDKWGPFGKFNKELCEQARQEGYDEGVENGYTTGYDDGYDIGYSEGYTLGRDNGHKEDLLSKAIINAPSRYIRNIFNHYNFKEEQSIEILIFYFYLAVIIYYPTFIISKKYDIAKLFQENPTSLLPFYYRLHLSSSEINEMISDVIGHLEDELTELWGSEKLESNILILAKHSKLIDQYTQVSIELLNYICSYISDSSNYNPKYAKDITEKILTINDLPKVLSDAILDNINFCNKNLDSFNFHTISK